MKLIMENWKRFLTESDSGFTFQGQRPNYSSIILNNDSVKLLINEAQKLQQSGKVPSDYKSEEGRWPHHMTINMGPLLEGWSEGEEYTLKINAFGVVDTVNNKGKKVRAMAFRIDPASYGNLPIKNETAHITAMVPPDGKPFHSNSIAKEIYDQNPISLEIKGNVVAAAEKSKKPKPQKQKKQNNSKGNPVEFAKSLAKKNKNFNEIKDEIMKKFNKSEQAALGIMKGAGIK